MKAEGGVMGAGDAMIDPTILGALREYDPDLEWHETEDGGLVAPDDADAAVSWFVTIWGGGTFTLQRNEGCYEQHIDAKLQTLADTMRRLDAASRALKRWHGAPPRGGRDE